MKKIVFCRWTLVLAAGAVLGAAGLVSGAERSLERRLASWDLESARPLEGAVAPPEVVEIRRQLAAVRRGFEAYDWEPAPETGCEPFAPGEWVPELRELLQARLTEIEPSLALLDALLAQERTRQALAAGEVVTGAATELLWSRRQINALCARALVAASTPDGSRRSIDSLAAALDFSALVDDGTEFGMAVRAGLDGITLDSVRRVLASGSVDARAMHAALEPRLARWDSQRKIDDVLARELAIVLSGEEECARLCIVPARLVQLVSGRRCLDEADERRVSVHGFLDSLARGEDPIQPGESSPPEATFAKTAFVVERQHDLARVALALAALRQRDGRWPHGMEALEAMFEDRVPVDPFGGRPFRYQVDRDDVRVALSDADLRPGAPTYGAVWRLTR